MGLVFGGVLAALVWLGLAGRVLAIVVLALLLATPARAQSRVFYDGFEPGARASWTVDKCTPVPVAADGGAPAAGTSMQRCAWDGTLDWRDPGKLRDMAIGGVPYVRDRLFRFRIRYDANVDHAQGSKEWRTDFDTPAEVFGACQLEAGAGATLFVAGNSIASYWGGVTPARCLLGAPPAWREVAIFRRDAVNGVGGIVRVWNNGALLREWTGNTGGHVAGTGISLPSNWSSNPGWSHDAVNYVYFDEVEILTDVATGAPVTGRLEDNTARVTGAPPAPTCVGVWAETLSAPDPLVCDARAVQTRTRTRTFTITTPGAGCPASPVVDTIATPCTYTPPAPPEPPSIVGQFRSQAVYTAANVPAGLRVTISIPSTVAPPAVGAPVSLAVPTLVGGLETRVGRVRRVTLNAYKGPPAEHAVELEFPKAATDPGVTPIRLRVTLTGSAP